MRTFKVSDELYEQLKGFIVDPFDDTPEIVIGRLIEIANKAKGRWSALDRYDHPEPGEHPTAVPHRETRKDLPQQPLHELPREALAELPRELPYEHIENEVIL